MSRSAAFSLEQLRAPFTLALLISGALGFFQAASSRGADRRLALAGLGAPRVATSRIAASVLLATAASGAAYIALLLRVDVSHPLHAAAGVLAFALLCLGIGVLVGSIVTAPLEGSLLVVFVFLLDAFAGPGMSGGSAPFWAMSRDAAELLIAAGMGTDAPAGQWLEAFLSMAVALSAGCVAFVMSARKRA